MPNKKGIITAGATTRGFNDGSDRGYPLWLVLSTGQVSDVVRFDEDMLQEPAPPSRIGSHLLIIWDCLPNWNCMLLNDLLIICDWLPCNNRMLILNFDSLDFWHRIGWPDGDTARDLINDHARRVHRGDEMLLVAH